MSIGAIMPNVSPPEPPVDLTEAQKVAWADVVSRLPSGWWRGSFPDGLVKQLVRHMAYADHLASELEQAIESGQRLRLTTQINRQTQLTAR